MNQGNEGGIVTEWTYARLRGNSNAWPVYSMPTDPNAKFPCIAFNIQPAKMPQYEQGGDVLAQEFLVQVLVCGATGVDDLEPLRGMAAELAASMRLRVASPGSYIAGGAVIQSVIHLPVCYSDNDTQGVPRWYLGHQWRVMVQPDAAAH